MAIMVQESDFPAGTPNHLGMRIGCYVLFGVCTVVVLARIYVRTIMAHKLGLDDILIFTAWVAEVIVIVCVKLMFESGIGWHTADIMTLPNGMDILTRMVLWPWVTQILYFFGLGCIKASIVALYLRLAVTDMQKRILWVALVFVLLQGLASAITVAAFLCSPISIVWTGKHGGFGGPNCVNILAFNYYNAAVFIATDIALAIGPIFIIRKLHMDRKKKIGLCIMFALGMLAIGGTISRQVTNAIAVITTSDFTWYWAAAELCSVLESSLGIIFVSMPAVAPLFQSWISGSSAMDSTSKNGAYKLSDRPGTFGKIGVRPKLRPDDESILYATRVSAVDPRDHDVVEGFEADRTTTYSHGDSGSEREIIAQKGNVAARSSRREEQLSQDKGKVQMNVEHLVERSER